MIKISCHEYNKFKRDFNNIRAEDHELYISITSDSIMWSEQQRNDNNSNIVTAIVCPPPTPTLFVKCELMSMTGL